MGLASSAGSDLAARRPPMFVAAGLWGVAVALLAGAVFVGVAAAVSMPRRRRRVMAWMIGLAGLALLARGVLVEIALAADAGGGCREVGPHPNSVESGAVESVVHARRCAVHRRGSGYCEALFTADRSCRGSGCGRPARGSSSSGHRFFRRWVVTRACRQGC
ncbi:hypothetical protein [Nocardia sp. NBC_01377]|uniref:hypothetical protein n=1 Tax=Nocardia sp. NBC_01377 TaxID=2903595 RepID=UPI0038665C4C